VELVGTRSVRVIEQLLADRDRIAETADSRYRTVCGSPPRFGLVREFDTVEAALEETNIDGGGVRIEFVDEFPPGKPRE
jgi:hypothetical protein